jgi:cytochrome oxidase Cu insertion factor (SCO1/SenC/PrrC family)
MKRTFLLFALLAATPLSARVTPAIETAARVPDAHVIDEDGNGTSIHPLLAAMGGGPVVILPTYTHCVVSCPVQTHKLKQALAGLDPRSPLRVLVFSFDPEETTQTLREYKKREGLPKSWSVVRASEPEIREFFDFFHYWVMNEKGQLAHPDQIFLLDPSLQWRFTVAGLNWSPDEIGQALGQARSPGLMLWMRTHPNELACAGFLIFLGSIGSLWFQLIRHRTPNRSISS